MKRRISTTEIDRFFDQLKEQPAIYNEEKVRQIINSPAAKARLKGKSQNLLKFTIMTTIFAAILSAVLLLSNSEGEIPRLTESSMQSKHTQNLLENSNTQKTKSIIEKKFKKESLMPLNEIDPKNADEIYIIKKDIFDPSLNSNNEESSLNTINKNEDEQFESFLDTIKPINGEKFFVTADLDLLGRLGLDVNEPNLPSYITPTNDTIIYHTQTTALNSLPLGNEFYRKDYYPVFQTYMNGRPTIWISVAVQNGRKTKRMMNFNFYESANDTLLPIIIPAYTLDINDPNDFILWFRISENLFDLLPELEEDTKTEIKQIIKIKRKNPQKDFVQYSYKSLIPNTKFIELDIKTMEKLGVKVTDSQLCCYSQLNDTLISERKFDLFERPFENLISDTSSYHFIPIATSNIGAIKFIEDGYKFNELIPVTFKWDSLNDLPNSAIGIIFWFKPTESFFNALPDNISLDLRKEYNYVIAEDKSALVQPECKYFDECKNTLKVSSFKVYPNPASANATVSFTLPEAINGRITLVDLAGHERQVLKPQTSYAKGQHSISVDLSNVPEGLYLLTLYSSKGVQTQRVIVAR